MTHTSRFAVVMLLVGVLFSAGSCTLKKQDPPPMTGPSEFGTSLQISAAPDVVLLDGASQSVISVVARDSNADPIRNLPLRAEISVGGVLVDYGRLSARTIATDNTGRASVVYTAPQAPMVSPDSGTIVDVYITPIGTDYNNATPRFVSIRVVPPGVIIPPNSAPVADFTITPSAGVQGDKMTFDASPSTDPDGDDTIVAWSWSFSDGDTRSGKVVQIAFDTPGTYSATLTVTDIGGLTGSTTKPFTVGASTAPTATFVYGPSPVRIGATVFFNAAASTAAAGRTIVSYAWNFGDGTTATGVAPTHAFASAATYNVTLTVTDDVGRSTTVTQSVAVIP